MAESRRIVSEDYGSPYAGLAYKKPRKMTKWREPTSTGTGKVRYRERDEAEGVDYLYDRTESVVPLMQPGIFGQAPTQRRSATYGGMGGELLFTKQTRYVNKTLAPGQSPRGARQPEVAKRASLSRTGGGQAGGRAAATKRSKAGQRGTILSSGSKTGGSGKTLLGG